MELTGCVPGEGTGTAHGPRRAESGVRTECRGLGAGQSNPGLCGKEAARGRDQTWGLLFPGSRREVEEQL